MLGLFVYQTVSRCPVYLMAPLDLINNKGAFNDKAKITGWLDKCKLASVDGIMVDVWWGICEPSPKAYKFTAYKEFFDLCVARNLKIIPVLSFHKCGENVGDKNTIPLPSFVTDDRSVPFFKDFNGNVDKEYISFAYDKVTIAGRTPLQMYEDFMVNFKSTFSTYITQKQIIEIEIGVGPCGELRFPAYRESTGWSYPGCGNFQVYDTQMKAILSANGISDSNIPFVDQNDTPEKRAFWSDGAQNNYLSPIGVKMVNSLHQILIDHADGVFERAKKVYGTSVKLAAKIAGLHWWYNTGSHCIETAAGYKNFHDHNGYLDIIKVFKKYSIHVCFTCLELLPNIAQRSDPPALVNQLLEATKNQGLDFEGENALPCYDDTSFGRIASWISKGLKAFTYLRLDETLVQTNNWAALCRFINKMHA